MGAVNLKEWVVAENNKYHMHRVALWVLEHNAIESLLVLLFETEGKYAQKAAWVLQQLFNLDNKIGQKHTETLIRRLKLDGHIGVRRAIFQTLEQLAFDEEQTGFLIEESFNALANPDETIAVKVYAMSLLANVCAPYPELLEELKQVLEFKLSEQSAGYRSRANKVLALIDKKSNRLK